MRHFGLLCALTMVGSTASCFNVDFTGLSFQCDTTQPGQSICPDGYQCDASKKLCVATGPTSLSDLGAGGDMAGGPVVTNACPSGMGYDVGIPGQSKVYACQTTFSNTAGNTADAQCKNGYTICQNATNVNFPACSRVGAATNGFFISAEEVHRNSTGSEIFCGAPSSPRPYPLWAGCGRTQNTTSLAGGVCAGFTTALDCPQSGSPFNCGGKMMSAQLNDVSNSDPMSGVLCCGP